MANADINIRIATIEDAKALLDIYSPYVKDTAITFEYETPSESDFETRIRNTLSRYPYIVAQSEGELVGYAYAGPFKARPAYSWSVETSVYVRQGQKRMGIGARLYEALEQILKSQGILNMYACIAQTDESDEHLSNDSIAFHERLGFQLVGKFHECGYKFNRWYNMVWMEKHIGAHLINPPEVKTFAQAGKQICETYGIM